MTHTFTVSVEVDAVTGLIPVFVYSGSGGNPFSLEEWTSVRKDLREELLPEIPNEFEELLGLEYQYTIGEIEVDEEGEIVEKNIDTSVDQLREQLD